ncbi:hypothetical protein HA466_0029520 [Hirschfeldia incana]|nr:hypothetical protein HA466_0029520 [Hirschfeldia incana]
MALSLGLERVSNVSGKRVYVNMTDGKVFGLEDGESKSINGVITNDIYTMFEKDVHGYTMMYDDNNKNLVINDTLGVKKSFAETEVFQSEGV